MKIDEVSGGDDNKWLDSAPTAGDGTGGNAMPGHGMIDVKPDGVKLFSTQADGEAKDFQSNFADGVAPLMGQSAKIGAPFYEASDFAEKHGQGFEAMGLFHADAQKGLIALSQGARTVAMNYLDGDSTSAATMTDVEHAFDVSGGKGLFNAPTPADGSAPPTGQQHPGTLPPAQTVDPDDYATNPDVTESIPLGDHDSYTIPAEGSDDIERLDPQDDIQETEKKFQDDLADQDFEPAPYSPDDYR